MIKLEKTNPTIYPKQTLDVTQFPVDEWCPKRLDFVLMQAWICHFIKVQFVYVL